MHRTHLLLRSTYNRLPFSFSFHELNMAESNVKQQDTIEHLLALHFIGLAQEFQYTTIIVSHDKDRINTLKQILTDEDHTVNNPVHLFDNSEDCEHFVEGELWENKNAKCSVLISKQFANELIPYISFSDQIKEIHILDEISMSQEEKESLKQYSKVCRQIKACFLLDILKTI